jgi:uncharacterized protein with FMN-binding domain
MFEPDHEGMKTKHRVPSIIVASALVFGALSYALRGAPVVRHAIAQLRARDDSVGPAPAVASNAGRARNALQVSGQGTAAGGIDKNVSFQKNGTYAGRREYAYYGFVKVQAVISGGQLKDVTVVEYPNDNGRSQYINSVALPYLIQEAVSAQSAKVDFISGATFTSFAFTKSLQEALKAAGA